MDIETIWQELGNDQILPRAALIAAGEQREALIPRFVELIERRPAGGYESPEDEGRIFFGFHLLGEWRAHAAAPAMARLLGGEKEQLVAVFGDFIHEAAPRVMASVIGDDPRPLQELCLDRGADQFLRSGAFKAIAIAVGHGRLDRERAVDFLKDAYYRLPKRENSYAWSGWLDAVAWLGIEELRPLAMTVFERRYIDPFDFAVDDFEYEFAKHKAEGGALVAGGAVEYRLWTDTLGELSVWFAGNDQPKPPPEPVYRGPDTGPPLPVGPPHDRPDPQPNFGRVGRNAPCPCGSAQKYKRCHGR